MRELLDVKGLASTTRAFRAKLIQIADELGLDPSYMAAVMSFETAGTFSPSIKNFAGSGAVGLIQFMPDRVMSDGSIRKGSASLLGTSVSKLAKLTATQQLTYVGMFYKGIGASRITTPLDHYMAVFSPAFIGSDYSTAMYVEGTKAYDQNKGLDDNEDGVITVGDVAAKFLAIITHAEARPRLLVNEHDAPSPRGTLTGLSVALIALSIYALSKLTYATHQAS